MNTNNKLSDIEYENLSLEYEKNPPRLSGKPGFISYLREKNLVNELLSPDYARIIIINAKVMQLSPSEVISHAIKKQLLENT